MNTISISAEVLGREEATGGLTPEELALTKSDSIAVVSVSGKLEWFSTFAIVAACRVSLIWFKNFKLPKSLIVRSRTSGFPIELVKTVNQLGKVLEQRNWREWPAIFDVPVVPQIFGGVVMDAGIEGILYKSAITGAPCLVVFPQNFQNSSSWIKLDDPVPIPEVRGRIDSGNFSSFV